MDLVFRGTQDYCTHNPKKISAMHAELVFRELSQGSRGNGGGKRSGSGGWAWALRWSSLQAMA